MNNRRSWIIFSESLLLAPSRMWTLALSIFTISWPSSSCCRRRRWSRWSNWWSRSARTEDAGKPRAFNQMTTNETWNHHHLNSMPKVIITLSFYSIFSPPDADLLLTPFITRRTCCDFVINLISCILQLKHCNFNWARLFFSSFVFIISSISPSTRRMSWFKNLCKF